MGTSPDPSTFDNLLEQLGALASPHRLALVRALADGRVHVSGLARAIGISRPLVHMHLQKLEAAGFVRGSLELSDDGKAMKYFELVPFRIELTPDTIASLTPEEPT